MIPELVTIYLYAQALTFLFFSDSEKSNSLMFSINTMLAEIQINLFKI
jgi:hypothetical protein